MARIGRGASAFRDVTRRATPGSIRRIMRRSRFEASEESSRGRNGDGGTGRRFEWAEPLASFVQTIPLIALIPFFVFPLPIQAEDWVEPSIAKSAPAPSALEVLAPISSNEKIAPFALAIDDLGRLFALDRENDVILRSGEKGWVTFSAGAQGGRRLAIIVGLAALGPDLFALDPVELTLYRFDLDGRLKTPISLRPGLLSRGIETVDAVDFIMTKSGELLLLDRGGRRLLLFDRFGAFVTDLASGATGAERFRSPLELTQDGAGEVYVLDAAARKVRRFSRQGESRPSWSYDDGLSDKVSRGSHIAATPWGQVIVASGDGAWLRVFSSDGDLLRHEEFEDRAGFVVSELVAGPDSVLYLAQPERGDVGRLGLNYPSVVSAPHR